MTIEGANPKSCYYLSTQLKNRAEARQFCEDKHPDAHLPLPTTVGEVEALAQYLQNQENFDEHHKPGYWLTYERYLEGHLDPNNDYVKDTYLRRNTLELFVDLESLGDDIIMPLSLWRESQPGDRLDEIDERCVARKKPGDPNIQGVDDYSCFFKHHVFCELLNFLWNVNNKNWYLELK